MPNPPQRALVLHQERRTRELVAALLARRGIEVTCLRDGHGARVLLGRKFFDVLVASIWTGRESNSWALRAFRDAPRHPVPVIALTPQGDVGATRAALRAGAWDCLEEPINEAEFNRCLDDALALDHEARPEVHLESSPQGSALQALTPYSTVLERLARLRHFCQQHRQMLAVMMLDLDRFRECNERLSSTFGDQVLEWFASILQGASRASDLIARYEADRFIVVLPCAQEGDALEWAERCRARMHTEYPLCDGTPYEVQVSLGVVQSSCGFVETEHQLIRRARIALDHAKRAGGGRAATWSALAGAAPSGDDLEQLRRDGTSHWVTRVREQLRCTCLESTRALVAAVEAKDPYTRDHSLNVAAHAEALSRRLGFSARQVDTVRVAALLHDLGKIGVPDAVLTKPGPLSNVEVDLIQRHPRTALDILGHVSFLDNELPIILHHHERYDGSGYPDGLAGEQIPIGARVLAVADAMDAMFSGRCYQPVYDRQRVRAELHAGSGSQFDPKLVASVEAWFDAASPQATLLS